MRLYYAQKKGIKQICRSVFRYFVQCLNVEVESTAQNLAGLRIHLLCEYFVLCLTLQVRREIYLLSSSLSQYAYGIKNYGKHDIYICFFFWIQPTLQTCHKPIYICPSILLHKKNLSLNTSRLTFRIFIDFPFFLSLSFFLVHNNGPISTPAIAVLLFQ